MKRLLILPLLFAALAMSACPPSQPLEKSARDAVATSKGYLDAAKEHHPECVSDTPAASTNCTIISRGVAAKDSVIDAVNIYCASPEYSNGTGECIPNKDLEPKLKEALDNLNRTINDVKAVGGK